LAFRPGRIGPHHHCRHHHDADNAGKETRKTDEEEDVCHSLNYGGRLAPVTHQRALRVGGPPSHTTASLMTWRCATMSTLSTPHRPLSWCCQQAFHARGRLQSATEVPTTAMALLQDFSKHCATWVLGQGFRHRPSGTSSELHVHTQHPLDCAVGRSHHG